jgi:hypothetical protein
MFCSQCGKPAQGKFCSNCGFALSGGCSTDQPVQAEILPDWDHEVRYEMILQYPGVRTTIERHARQANKRLSGEEFLAIAEKVVPMGGVPIEKVVAIAQPLLTRWGIKTGKHRTQQFPAPASKVLVRALCSLARHGQRLRNMTQAEDGCLIEAALPSDMFAFEGDLLVSVRRASIGAEVDAATQIGGQLFDWGKSNRSLDRLFEDLSRDAA